MKISIKKRLSKAIICLFLSLLCTTHVQAWYQTPSWYTKAKRIIHLVHHALTHKAEDLDDALASIDQQFAEFNLWIIAQEQKVLSAIKEKHAIDDALWQKCLQDIENTKASHKASLSRPHPQITHDPSIPTDIKNMLAALIENNGLNPQSITIHLADEAKSKAKPQTSAETIIEIQTITENNELLFKVAENPTKITIFPRLINASYRKKIITAAHELQHIISQHGITEHILLAYLGHYCNIDNTTFQKTTEYHQLCQIHEAQAEILAALADENVAHHLKIYREKNHYPGFLYEDHFYCLSTIDTLWKLRKKLQELYCCLG